MPSVSIKQLLASLKTMNRLLDEAAEIGRVILTNINNIDFTSITDNETKEKLEEQFEETGEVYRKLNDQKNILLYSLQRNVINELNSTNPSSRTKSLSLGRKKRFSNKRTVRRTRTI